MMQGPALAKFAVLDAATALVSAASSAAELLRLLAMMALAVVVSKVEAGSVAP